ncbi:MULTISPECIES: FkbM family methyltransferase [unclassified Thiocapsa]|uniref:FkbM family methyltransferase n=1 Tax=unclassified Thiocapsa TaxID=2641286 RepID=UPI0035AE48E8
MKPSTQSSSFKPLTISGHTFIPALLSQDSIVIDVGANLGAFASGLLAILPCKIYAVEPTPYLALKLREINHITVIQCALSAESGSMAFEVDATNSEASRLVSGSRDHAIQVQCVTLDHLLDRIDTIDLLKLDIEGSEIEVLLSASAGRLMLVKQISVEFHDFIRNGKVTAKMVSDVCNRLEGIGFKKFKMSHWTNGDVLFINTGLVPLSRKDSLFIRLNGRWLPGFSRVLKRLIRQHSSVS